MLFNAVSWVGSAAVVAGDKVGHDGMNHCVWSEQGWEEAPKADWSDASVVAPTVCVTHPHLRNPPRGFLGSCSSLADGSRNKVDVQFLPTSSRSSFYDGGTQAFSSQWHDHEVNVVFYAVGDGSECRNGGSKKNGGGVGASYRGGARKKGKTKGSLFGR